MLDNEYTGLSEKQKETMETYTKVIKVYDEMIPAGDDSKIYDHLIRFSVDNFDFPQ